MYMEVSGSGGKKFSSSIAAQRGIFARKEWRQQQRCCQGQLDIWNIQNVSLLLKFICHPKKRHLRWIQHRGMGLDHRVGWGKEHLTVSIAPYCPSILCHCIYPFCFAQITQAKLFSPHLVFFSFQWDQVCSQSGQCNRCLWWDGKKSNSKDSQELFDSVGECQKLCGSMGRQVI